MEPDAINSVVLRSGSKMYYEVTGTGPTLLQIGGGALSKRQFARLTPILAQSFRVIDVDLPGFGESDPPTHSGTIDGWAEDAADLVSALGLDAVHVHGISAGGAIAIALAAAHPGHVDRLVVGAHLARMDGYARLLRSTWRAAALQGGMRMAADLVALSGFSRSYLDRDEAESELEWMREAFERTEPATFVAAMASLNELDQAATLREILAPTLLIGGAQDIQTPIDVGPSGVGMRQMRDAIRDSVLAVFAQRGHCYFVEDPQTTAQAMTEFLNGKAITESAEFSVLS